ncbi:bifunctional folylpolyglutamate synthase/dihydrofolate synthase [Tardiphaga sp.]|uniref:bifunctional folylpolyglutamate synthase/dihydrofolate synthase n=1 Tax=Tardiphaga sp. TaxID=1926292 RepID=UPI0037D9EEDC
MSETAPTSSPLGEILARLSSLHPNTIDLSLERMQRLMAQLGHPERRLPPTIHVAGTNGKGSTIAYLRAILEAAGLGVHVYTSPHLVRMNESIRLGGMLISDDDLRDAFAHVEAINAGAPITLFEAETAVAFHIFASHPADVLLLEVGLGGRLDATNVIEAPIASVITPIAIDHTDFLGDTIAKIATEKAGIIKRRAPVIIAEQLPDVAAVLEAEARKHHAPTHSAGQEWHISVERGRLVYQDDRGLMDLAAPRLFGRHQFGNAGLAIATRRAIPQFRFDPSVYERGVAGAEWPARMQRLTSGKLLALAPDESELWLDGGHNAEGGRVIAEALGDLEERVPRPLVVIVGMMANKDASGFLTNFAGLTRHIIAVPIPDRVGAMPVQTLVDAGRALGMRVETADSAGAALQSLRRLAYEVPPRVLICGSLYLAGHVLAENGTLPA